MLFNNQGSGRKAWEEGEPTKTELPFKIWRMLSEDSGLKNKDMAASLQVSEGTISKTLAKLEKLGIIKTDRSSQKLFNFVEKDEEKVRKLLKESSGQLSSALSKDNHINQAPAKLSQASWRSNNLRLEAWHEPLDKGKLSSLGFIEIEWSRNNSYWQKIEDGYRILVYSKALQIYAPQKPARIESSKAQEFKDNEEKLIYGYLFRFEQLGYYKLRGEGGRIPCRIISHEMAQTNNELASASMKEAERLGLKRYVVLAFDEATGEIRIIADASDPEGIKLDELEALMKEWSGQDSDRLRELCREFGKEGLKEFWDENKLEGTKEAVSDTVNINGYRLIKERQEWMERTLSEYGKQLSVHIPVLENTRKEQDQNIILKQQQIEINGLLIENLKKQAPQARQSLLGKLKKRLGL